MICLILCEGLREVRFVQSVIEFYLKFRLLTKDEIDEEIGDKLKQLIKNLKVESVYKNDGNYYVVINMQSTFSKLLKDRNQIEAYKNLEEDENVRLIIVADKEYEKLREYFDNCLIFNNRIEDFILNIVKDLNIEIDKTLLNNLIGFCVKYNDRIDEDKIKVQLYHLILSAGECDKKMFARIFKLSEGKIIIDEVEILKNLLNL